MPLTGPQPRPALPCPAPLRPALPSTRRDARAHAPATERSNKHPRGVNFPGWHAMSTRSPYYSPRHRDTTYLSRTTRRPALPCPALLCPALAWPTVAAAALHKTSFCGSLGRRGLARSGEVWRGGGYVSSTAIGSCSPPRGGAGRGREGRADTARLQHVVWRSPKRISQTIEG